MSSILRMLDRLVHSWASMLVPQAVDGSDWDECGAGCGYDEAVDEERTILQRRPRRRPTPRNRVVWVLVREGDGRATARRVRLPDHGRGATVRPMRTAPDRIQDRLRRPRRLYQRAVVEGF
jgi:hypothetical protein